MFQVQIIKNKAWVEARETLTLYCQGCDPVKIGLSFDDDWDGLSKIAVFRAYDRQIDLAFTGDEIEIPVNALLKPDVHLLLGIYGINSTGTVVISTIWADLGIIQPGPNPTAAENYSLPPENIYQQVYELAQAAANSAAEAASAKYMGAASFSIDNNGYLVITITYTDPETEETTTTTSTVGPVTAYGIAKAGGYDGTYEDFQTLLMANGRTAYEVDQALALVEDLSDAVDTANTNATNAVNTANNAAAAATAAQGLASEARAVAFTKQNQHEEATLNLAANASSWTVSCQGVTTDNLVIWSPAPASLDDAASVNLRLTAQAANSLTFTADNTTTEAIAVNVAIFDV